MWGQKLVVDQAACAALNRCRSRVLRVGHRPSKIVMRLGIFDVC
jgi:hypothetical protein